MASPNLSEIVTTTLQNRSRTLADNVSNNTALLQRLRSKGNVRPASGGRTIIEELEYAENQTYKRYSGYEVLDISPSDVISAAEYNWKQAAVAVSISGLEQLQNSSREQMIDLLDGRIRNAERTFVNNLSADIYSDGTADGGKQVGGMQLLVSDAGTGTVGGIDSSSFTFWQNAIFDASVESVTLSATTIQNAMNRLWLRTKRNNDVTDLIIADDNFYIFYWDSLQAIQRIGTPGKGEAGFGSLKYKGADVIPDGGKGGNCPANHMYFLNTDFIFYRPHSQRDMVPLNPDRHAVNQDAVVKLVGWTGNMTSSNRSQQGAMVL